MARTHRAVAARRLMAPLVLVGAACSGSPDEAPLRTQSEGAAGGDGSISGGSTGRGGASGSAGGGGAPAGTGGSSAGVGGTQPAAGGMPSNAGTGGTAPPDPPIDPGCGDGIQQIELGEHCDEGPAGGADCDATCNPRYDVLFDPSAVPAFYLTLPAASWDSLGACTLGENGQRVRPPQCDYHPATVHVVYDPDPTDGDPTTVQSDELSIGVRRKGRASWRDLEPPPLDWAAAVFDRPGKSSLKLKFDAFGGGRFLGLTRITLNNGVQDPSGVRERLAHHLFRAAGLYAPRANSALLYVRREGAADYTYWGVYVNVETLDKRFLKYHFGEVGGAVGNLYDTHNDVYFTELDRCRDRDQAGDSPGAQEARFQLETNEAIGDTSDLTAAIDSVYEYGTTGLFGGGCRDAAYAADTFVSRAETSLDFDYFLREFATDFVFSNWDGYAATRNNYKLYHDLARDRFVLLPWGTDQSFAWQDGVYYPNWTYSFEHQSSGHRPSHVMNRCIADRGVCWPRYLEHVRQAHALFDGVPLRELRTTWQAQIAGLIEWTPEEFDRHGTFLDHYLEQRSACIQAQLDGRSCATLTCPSASGCDETPRP